MNIGSKEMGLDSGFTTKASYSLSSAFEKAYANLMSQVSETIFQEEE